MIPYDELVLQDRVNGRLDYGGTRGTKSASRRAPTNGSCCGARLRREEVEPSGALSGYETDEATQRGLWRHYREVMGGGAA